MPSCSNINLPWLMSSWVNFCRRRFGGSGSGGVFREGVEVMMGGGGGGRSGVGGSSGDGGVREGGVVMLGGDGGGRSGWGGRGGSSGDGDVREGGVVMMGGDGGIGSGGWLVIVVLGVVMMIGVFKYQSA